MMSTLSKKIEPEFLDLVNYGVCSALTALYGSQAAETVFRLAGEFNYEELKGKSRVDSSSPIDALRSIASYLEKSGYMGKIDLTRVTENEVIVDMYGVSVAESSKRLVDEGKSPSHYMTNMMFAALKDLFQVKAEITHLDIEIPKEETDHVREKWILKKGSQP